MAITLKNEHGVSNGSTDVTIVTAPTAGVTKIVRSITAINTGATARTVTIKFSNATDDRIIVVKTLAQNRNLVFTAALVLEATADKLEIVLDAGTNEVHWTTHFAEVS